MNYDALVERLVAERKACGATVTETARRHGVSPQLLSNREKRRSRADLDQAQEWARAVGLELIVELLSEPDSRAVHDLLSILRDGGPDRARLTARYLRLTAAELSQDVEGELGASKAVG